MKQFTSHAVFTMSSIIYEIEGHNTFYSLKISYMLSLNQYTSAFFDNKILTYKIFLQFATY